MRLVYADSSRFGNWCSALSDMSKENYLNFIREGIILSLKCHNPQDHDVCRYHDVMFIKMKKSSSLTPGALKFFNIQVELFPQSFKLYPNLDFFSQLMFQHVISFYFFKKYSISDAESFWVASLFICKFMQNTLSLICVGNDFELDRNCLIAARHIPTSKLRAICRGNDNSSESGFIRFGGKKIYLIHHFSFWERHTRIIGIILLVAPHFTFIRSDDKILEFKYLWATKWYAKMSPGPRIACCFETIRKTTLYGRH